MTDFLANMAAGSEARAARLPDTYPARRLDKPAYPLRRKDFDIIAEIKGASPSAGKLATSGLSRSDRASAYISGGAAAISVLTEPSRFAGDVAHLTEVAEIASRMRIPVMRKDFLVCTAQVLEAKAFGASGVLLIAAMLSDGRIEDMLHCAWEHGMFVLLEAFNEEDLRRAGKLLDKAEPLARAEAGHLLLGVNARNLRTLFVDSSRLERFGRALPDGAVCVAESGLATPDDAANAVTCGYRVALVGTALMRSDDPATLLRAMLSAGRLRAYA